MARARNIKPGLFVNDELAEVEPLGRLLFIGLWTIADREGRLKDRPKKIKAQTLPFDNCDVDSLLNQLQEHGFIYRYKSGECSYIQVLNFTKHQNPHIKEQESEIPAPDLHHTSIVQEQELHEASPADSLNPITDSLKPIKKDVNNFFESIWQLYPRKVGKGQISDKKKKELHSYGYDVIKQCIDRYKKDKKEWQEWKHGSTFFNSGFIDYLDENYSPESEEPNKQHPEHNYL